MTDSANGSYNILVNLIFLAKIQETVEQGLFGENFSTNKVPANPYIIIVDILQEKSSDFCNKKVTEFLDAIYRVLNIRFSVCPSTL